MTPLTVRSNRTRWLLALAWFASAGLPLAQEADATPGAPGLARREGDVVSVFSGDVRIPAGTLQEGSVVCIGGRAIVEGSVEGDIVVVLGSAEISGDVDGSVIGVLSGVTLAGSHVDGGLYNVLGPLDVARSRIELEMVNVLGSLSRDAETSVDGQVVDINVGSWFPRLWPPFLFLRMFLMLATFVLVLLLTALMPDRVRVIGEEAPSRYVAAFFVGLVGYLGLLIVVGLLMATIVGIPFALLGFVVLQWLGIAGIFYAVGRRLGRAVGRDVPVLGAVLLTFAIYVAVMLVPSLLGLPGLALLVVLWFLFVLLVKVPAVGLVILTRAGGRSRPTPAPPAAAPARGPSPSPAS